MQVFHLVPTELACLKVADPAQKYECTYAPCKSITDVMVGKLFEFYAGEETGFQYRVFCTYAHALAEMDPKYMDKA